MDFLLVLLIGLGSSPVLAGSTFTKSSASAGEAAYVVTDPVGNTNAPEGDSFQFSVVAGGSEPLNYQWLKDLKPIAGATSPTFTLPSLQFSDTGAYSAWINNSFGAVTSKVATVIVRPKIPIVTQPQSQDLTEGQALYLRVTVGAVSPITYQWYKDGQPVESATRSDVFVEFSITSVTVADAGSYTVTVSNAYGSTTAGPAVVRVGTASAPRILTQPQGNTNAMQGTAVTLSVVAGGSEPLSYQWLKQFQPLSGAISPTLTLPAVQFSDTAAYQVIVRNGFGAVTSAIATIIVRPSGPIPPLPVAPTIQTQPPASIAFIKDQPFTLSVVATGTEPLAYQWYKDGQPLPGANSATLTVAASSTEDAGEYKVMVSNFAGAATTASCRAVFVADPGDAPFIIIAPQTETNAPEGTTFSFSVVAGGREPLTYQWLKFDRWGARFFAPLVGATSPLLTLADLKLSDSEWYQVVVRNAYGSVTSSARLEVKPKVPVIWRQPFSQEVVIGKSILLGVEVAAVSPISYQWYRNGEAINGATESILRITSAREEDAGEYYARISNAYGTVVSASVVVAVFDNKPEIVIQPAERSGFRAGDLTLDKLDVSARGDNPQFLWYRDGQLVRHSSPINEYGALFTETFSTYWTPEDSGDYVVIVSNRWGTATSRVAHVTVSLPAPHIKRPSNTTTSDLRHDLVAYWPLDERNGNKTPDVVSGYDLVLGTSAIFNIGRRGNAIKLPSYDNEGASRTNAPEDELPITKHPAFTISFWCKVPALGSSQPLFFQEGDIVKLEVSLDSFFGIGPRPVQYDFAGGWSGPAVFTMRRPASPPIDNLPTISMAFEGAKWHHFTFVQENDGRRWAYIDGKEDDVALPPKPAGAWSPEFTRLGGDRPQTLTAAICCPPGSIALDDVALWKRALTAEEIQLLITDGVPGFEPNVLKIESFAFSQDAETVEMKWKAPGEGLYRVLKSTNLLGPWEVLTQEPNPGIDSAAAGTVPPSAVTNVTDRISREGQVFYQIQRQLNPF